MKRYFKLLKAFLKLRWRIVPPKHTPVLLYFTIGKDVIAPYFGENEFQVLDIREREVNLPVIFLCLIDRDLSAQNYALRYINSVKPKLVITFIDNFPPFYRIKEKFPKIKTVLLQNGIRSQRGDLFGKLLDEVKLHSNWVDYMFVFGSAIGQEYRKQISGEVIVGGSFKNNLVPKTPDGDKVLAYISTYRPLLSKSALMPSSSEDAPVLYEEIVDRRARVVTFLSQYCESHDLELLIIGKDEHPELEQEYYGNLLKDFRWKFSARTEATSSYQALSKAKITVFTSSSLGYESLARGKKTAAFLIDAEIFDDEALRFGWPRQLPDDGKFWTHKLSENRFEEILDYLNTVSTSDWEQLRSETMRDVIEFDEGNSQFVALIDRLRLDW